MPLPKPTTLFEPYDDDTTNSHSEEEYDDPKPQKPSSNSKKKESHDEPPKSNSEKLVHSSTTKHPPDDDEIYEEDNISSGKAVKKLFERLFTEQNEITVFDKINDYISKNGGKDHFNDIDGFFLLINNSLQCEANSTKLKDEIKRMKEKYLKNFIKRERMRLSLVLKNYMIKAPYDDGTSDSDLEEEFDDPKSQKPCSYSVAEESSDETSELFTEQDEIIVLEGIHDYIIKNGEEESNDSKLQKSCSYSEEEEYGDKTSDTNSENSIHPPSN
ncbi:hypothetical protein ACFE04_021419 [Oxalis oulophora]